MSLTRAQWIEMWNEIKVIERALQENAIPPHSGYRRAIQNIVKDMKEKIQSVIGQME